MKRARFVAFCALAAVLPAGANDTAVTLGAGGLIPVKSSAIVMDSEDLQISVRQITVKYVFRNTSSRDLDLMVAFPLPEMDGGAVANIMMDIPSHDPLNFMDFSVAANGKKITPQMEVRAFMNATEITSQLRSLRLPLPVLDGNVTAAVKRLDNRDRARLESSGWFDCSLTKDGKCWPYWSNRIKFYWTQRFAAGAAVEVQHSYRPFVGGAWILAENTGYWDHPDYCPGANVLAQVRHGTDQQRAKARSGAIRRANEIQYILTTANSWSGPIRNFHLSVVADEANDMVLTCMPGLKQTAPTRYELVRQNFRPDREFNVMLLQAAKH